MPFENPPIIPCECGNPDCPGGVPVRPPFNLHVEPLTPDLETSLLYLLLRTTSWEWDGERTDIHDVFSLLWAASLRVREIASVQVVTVLNEFSGIPSEICARYLVLEQPGALAKATSLRARAEVLSAESLAIHALLSDAFSLDVSAGSQEEMRSGAEPAWMESVRRRYRLRRDKGYEVRLRKAPHWAYLGSNLRGFTAVEAPNAVVAKLRQGLAFAPPAGRCSRLSDWIRSAHSC